MTEPDRRHPYELTCPHEVTGRLIKVRHANEGDIAFIKEKAAQTGFIPSIEDYRRYVVADDDGIVIGFGTVQKTGSLSSFVIVTDQGSEFLGERIMEHMAKFPVPGIK